MIKHKLIRAQTKVIDAERGTVEAIVSTESEDRDGDIIRASGWKLGNFNAHPVLLSSHDYRKLQSQIGEWESMKVDRTAKTLAGVARYYVGEGNAEADWGFNLAAKGRAAYSVGFIPDMDKATRRDDDPDAWVPSYEFNGQELLEVSHVTIPSNPEALQAMKTLGMHPIVSQLVAEMSDMTLAPAKNSDPHLSLKEYIAEALDSVQAQYAELYALIQRSTIPADPGIDYRSLIGDEFKQLLEAKLP